MISGQSSSRTGSSDSYETLPESLRARERIPATELRRGDFFGTLFLEAT